MQRSSRPFCRRLKQPVSRSHQYKLDTSTLLHSPCHILLSMAYIEIKRRICSMVHHVMATAANTPDQSKIQDGSAGGGCRTWQQAECNAVLKVAGFSSSALVCWCGSCQNPPGSSRACLSAPKLRHTIATGRLPDYSTSADACNAAMPLVHTSHGTIQLLCKLPCSG